MDPIPDTYADPLALFEHYFARAQKLEPFDPTAVALATASKEGQPALRMVLLKGVESGGFIFFTNYKSRKASQLLENPAAALCFYWPTIGVQIRTEGNVEKLSPAASDAYFASRPRGSQLAAWSSEQSAPLADRAELLRRYAELEQHYADQEVPRPSFWGGYHLIPERIEFWQNEPYRMHDRLLYFRDTSSAVSQSWQRTRLFP